MQREKKRTKKAQIEKKKRNGQHWELLRWIVLFIKENKKHWKREKTRNKKKREDIENEEQWIWMTRNEKINKM